MPKPKNKGLGRGLDAIFTDNAIPETGPGEEARDRRAVPLSEIDVSADQPRKTFPPASLAELADSIARDGLLQPVLVRRMPADRYETPVPRGQAGGTDGDPGHSRGSRRRDRRPVRPRREPPA